MTVPINIEPVVPVAVPTSNLIEPESEVAPSALPVRKLKSCELVEPALVITVPTRLFVVSTLNRLEPAVS